MCTGIVRRRSIEWLKRFWKRDAGDVYISRYDKKACIVLHVVVGLAFYRYGTLWCYLSMEMCMSNLFFDSVGWWVHLWC
jgi:hypothetical protein